MGAQIVVGVAAWLAGLAILTGLVVLAVLVARFAWHLGKPRGRR